MLSPKIINYSVIIPHGKSLDTLSRAIDSVPQREDIEVIVVDNTPTPIAKTKCTPNSSTRADTIKPTVPAMR